MFFCLSIPGVSEKTVTFCMHRMLLLVNNTSEYYVREKKRVHLGARKKGTRLSRKSAIWTCFFRLALKNLAWGLVMLYTAVQIARRIKGWLQVSQKYIFRYL
jgi:hypothetical protein